MFDQKRTVTAEMVLKVKNLRRLIRKGEKMKDEKEIQTAWEIWILINRLNDLLFDHYHEDFQDLSSEEQDDLSEGIDVL